MAGKAFTREQVIAAFWAKVEKTDGCWNWTGCKTKSGYGQIWRGFSDKARTMQVAHRFAWELLVGNIPDKLELDHLCKNRKCVNPKHLELVTHWENLRRGDGFTGVNLRKTHCKYGHLLSGDNLLGSEEYRKHHGRPCKTCHRKYQNARYHRLKSL